MIIRKATGEDTKKVLEYCRAIGGETDNLTFGKEGVPFSEAQEKEYLENTYHSSKCLYLVAEENHEIVGACNLTTNSKPRLIHKCEIGISVRKSHWGKGVGSKLLGSAIEFAKEVGIEVINLNVRSDNVRAISLYTKFGFQKTGVMHKYLKIDGNYFYCDFMQLFL